MKTYISVRIILGGANSRKLEFACEDENAVNLVLYRHVLKNWSEAEMNEPIPQANSMEDVKNAIAKYFSHHQEERWTSKALAMLTTDDLKLLLGKRDLVTSDS